MGFFVVGNLKMRGGSVQLGADTNLYRKAANQLATDDGMHVAGTAGVVGAAQFTAAVTALSTLGVTGIITASAGVNAAAGTLLAVPYGTASPTVNANGAISFVQKADRSYLTFQAGGTPFHIMFPQTTHGTITVTVGGTP